MKSESSHSSGFGHVAALLIIVVLVAVAGAGVYVYNRSHAKKQDTTKNTNNGSNTNTSSDPYDGWKTATLTSPQLSIRYPSDWTITTTADGRNIEVKSPASNGHYLAVSLIAGKSQDVNLNFLGNAPGTKLLDLTVDGRALDLVAQTAGTDGAVTGLGLATTAGGANTSFGISDPQKTDNITMVASLTPITPTANDSGAEYSMELYTSHPAYQDVLKVFQSLSGDLPN